MAFLQMGLVVAIVVCLFVTGGALDRGFPVEVAIARGLVAFFGITLVGYVGELVVATAPPREQHEAHDARESARTETANMGGMPASTALLAPVDDDETDTASQIAA